MSIFAIGPGGRTIGTKNGSNGGGGAGGGGIYCIINRRIGQAPIQNPVLNINIDSTATLIGNTTSGTVATCYAGKGLDQYGVAGGDGGNLTCNANTGSNFGNGGNSGGGAGSNTYSGGGGGGSNGNGGEGIYGDGAGVGGTGGDGTFGHTGGKGTVSPGAIGTTNVSAITVPLTSIFNGTGKGGNGGIRNGGGGGAGGYGNGGDGGATGNTGIQNRTPGYGAGAGGGGGGVIYIPNMVTSELTSHQITLSISAAYVDFYPGDGQRFSARPGQQAAMANGGTGGTSDITDGQFPSTRAGGNGGGAYTGNGAGSSTGGGVGGDGTFSNFAFNSNGHTGGANGSPDNLSVIIPLTSVFNGTGVGGLGDASTSGGGGGGYGNGASLLKQTKAGYGGGGAGISYDNPGNNGIIAICYHDREI